MLQDLVAQMKIFWGLAGALVAAAIGILTRHIYTDGGFKWRVALWDMPFAMLSAIVAGGAGELLHAPAVVIYAIAGSIGYMSPRFLSDLIRKATDKKLGGGVDGEKTDNHS